MALTKCVLVPDQAGYSVVDGAAVVRVQLDGGAGRYRSDKINPSSMVNVTWTANVKEFRYLRSLYRSVTTEGASPFLIDLLLNGETTEEFTAYFIPGSMTLGEKDGDIRVVAAQLEVTPSAAPEDDADYVEMWNEFGEDFEAVLGLDDLDELSNATLPDHVPDLP